MTMKAMMYILLLAALSVALPATAKKNGQVAQCLVRVDA